MVVRVAVIPGDGIGKDVTAEAVKVLEAVAKRVEQHGIEAWQRITAAELGVEAEYEKSKTSK